MKPDWQSEDGGLQLHRCDCMDLMRQCPDKHFALAVVDPPYGISAPKMGMGAGFSNGEYYAKGRKNRLSQGAGKLKDRILQNGQSEWDAKPPGPEYFKELFRVSKNQVIWGGNYFQLPPTRCVVSWDKDQPWPNFSAWEMAWTSFDKPAKLFRWNNGGSGNPGKIHPTQKPVELYAWILSIFALPTESILDTHMGSGSLAIAAHRLRLRHTACDCGTPLAKLTHGISPGQSNVLSANWRKAPCRSQPHILRRSKPLSREL